jgi:hypothetical protein
MDLRRLRAGEWIAALAGTALIVSLFLPWFTDASGWEALTVVDALLLAVGAGGLAVLVVTAVARTSSMPLVTAALLTPVATVMIVVTLIRVLSVPDAYEGRELGAWLALIAVPLVAAGALISMRDERLSEPGRSTDQTGRPVPPPPEIPAIPPPRPPVEG